jgi:hypothetical protein
VGELQAVSKSDERRSSFDREITTGPSTHPGMRTFGPATIMSLQRTAGNSAVTVLLATSPDLFGLRVAGPLTVQRSCVPRHEIKTGNRYRYTTPLGRSGEAKLTQINGGWFTFDNGEKAHGAKNVHRPRRPEATAASSSDDSESSSEEMNVETGSERHVEERDVEDEPQHQSGALSFAQSILAAAQELGITNHVVLSALIEWIPDEIKLQELLRQQKRSRGGLELWRDPRTVAICMNTASNLVRLFVGSAGPAANGSATRGTPQTMAPCAQNLCMALQTNAPAGCMARITYGIHGFVVLCWGNHVEILQSFAAQSADDAETLAGNLIKPRTFTLQNACQVLMQMASTDVQQRSEGQTSISGDLALEPATVLEDAQYAFPNLDFNWSVYLIAKPELLLARILQAIKTNLPDIPERYHK